jgi:hypothetical protein
MLSTAILTGTIVMNYFFDTSSALKENPLYKRLHMSASIILLITGLANIFLIKGRKKIKPEHKIWVKFFQVKFFLVFLLTPLINIPLKRIVITQEDVDKLRTSI